MAQQADMQKRLEYIKTKSSRIPASMPSASWAIINENYRIIYYSCRPR
jgi:hypothetical protein